MARTVVIYLPAALVVALGWLRLERPHASGRTILWLLALALAPALGRRTRERVGLAVVASVLAAHTAFGVSILDARPLDGRHDFFGPLLGGFREGFLDFYDFPLPIDPGAHPLMHGVLLAAAFGSCLALGLAIAARRAFLAVLVVVVAAGWPATLLGGGGELRRGAIILGATLLVLAGLSARNDLVPGRALVAGGAVVACALAASTSPAVAKPEFLNWQHWDFYTRPQKAVSVQYVWNSSYDGIRFPKKRTTVLSVKGPAQPLYWRATTLDVFNGRAWVEDRTQPLLPPGRDPLLPPGVGSGKDKDLFREEITVRALLDRHLIGGSVPVAFEVPRALGRVRLLRSGTAIAARTLPRGGSYLAVSYAPQPTPAELAAAEPLYPPQLVRYGYLDVQPGLAVPAFGVPGREARIRELFDLYRFDTVLSPYRALYAKARAVVGQPSNPYAAALALETWFRTSGGFTYTERPGRAGDAPLVDFATRTKRGYCQHFAGAMALMLRYLGVPTRVAAGFTSGTYDHGTWTVTDHDAHMWVEAWFDGYGWLPFDPTPSRGALSGSYTAASHNFDLSAARRLLTLAAAGGVVGDPADYKQNNAFGEKGVAPTLGGAADARRAPATVPSSGNGAGASLLRLLVLIALVLLAGIVLAKLVLRRSRFLTKDPRRLAAACRRDLADFLADQRVALPASATPAEVGAAVELEYPVDAQRFVDALTMARFGPEQGAAAHASTARRELRVLERQIRRQLGIVERVLGLVSLRSLGFSA